MPLYIDDYLADTHGLNAAEHGAYLLLILHYWRERGLPSNDESLRRITRMHPKQWAASKSILLGFFVIHDDGRLTHNRIDQELAQAIEKSNTNSANAKRRHSKRTAGAMRTDHTLQTPDTVAKATDAKASEDPKVILFSEGVTTLLTLGVKDQKHARTMIGKWRRDAGEDCPRVLDAIRRARDQSVADPIPWITANLSSKVIPYGSKSRNDRKEQFIDALGALRDHGSGSDSDTEPVSEIGF